VVKFFGVKDLDPEASTIKLLKRFLIRGVLFEFAQLQHA